MNTAATHVNELCRKTRAAVPTLATLSHEARCAVLLEIRTALLESVDAILAANHIDLEKAAENGVPSVMLDRLKLTEARVADMAKGVEALVSLPDPLEGDECWERPSGLRIMRRRVPFGVLAIIFEARPNVTVDAAALAVKSGNAVVLRGGKEAIETNKALIAVLKSALERRGVSPDAVGLVTDTTRESATALLLARGLVDVLIPRGGKGLIRHCVENATVPVIETGAGNCHVYVDEAADLDKALRVAINAKCQRPSVCNAAEGLLCHRAVAAKFLPMFFEATRPWNVAFRADAEAKALLPQATAATEEDFCTEFNDYIMTVKIVGSVDEAIEHINRTGTGHSEAILTENDAVAERFMTLVDAAAVYRNASTRFTDGGEFGFGAEIGISTQKMHARGPSGPAALTTVKNFVEGDGTCR